MTTYRALWSALICLATVQPLVAAPPATAVYTNKNKFRIPFKFDPAEMRAMQAREIRLYLSRDRGLAWQHTQSVPPQAERFNFQADSDGEYWFLVRTLDGQNRLHPDSAPTEPGLQVIVDTTSPELKLELKQVSPGRVHLAWTATDLNLDVSQLRLEYIQPGQPDWQLVSVVPRAQGQTEWSVVQSGQVAVRGQIGDLARNVGQSQVQLKVTGSPDGTPVRESPASRHPVASPSGPDGSVPGQSPTTGGQSNLAQLEPTPGATAFRPLPSLNGADPLQDRQPGERSLNGSGVVAASPVSTSSRLGQNRFQEGFGPQIQELPGGAGSAESQPTPNPMPGYATQPSYVNGRYRLVNTLKFQLGYKIQDVGPSGVSAIDLFATENEGRTWYRYGEDNDLQSPALIDVSHEGVYGFDLRVRSGAGLSMEPPQPGDRAPIVVVVDTTAPKLELMPLEQGQGRLVNRLLIQWRYQDSHPHERPIQALYAASPQGPWQSIAGWIENTGKHVWIVGPEVPSKFYLRVEARDAAGNHQLLELPQPVLIDLQRPTARIIDIETSDSAPLPR